MVGNDIKYLNTIVMSRGDSYVREIAGYTKELARLKKERDKWMANKKLAEKHLYEYMVQMNLERVGDITKKSIAPKDKQPRKPKSAKKRDAINLFHKIGVPDPDSFWREFERTQKASGLD